MRETPDDTPLVMPRKDFAGGMNTRIQASNLPETQVVLLQDIDISVPGQTTKRNGIKLCNDVGLAGTGALGFDPDGGTNELLVTEDTDLYGATTLAEAGADVFTAHKSDFTAGYQTTLIKGGESGEGDVVFIGNGQDNWFRMSQSHTMQDLGSTAGTGSDSPPKSKVGAFFRNRLWVLKSNLAYFSDAYPSDYSTAFDTVTNAFRMPVGTERALIPLRELGLIVIGEDQIWGLNPSVVPDPATDKPEKLLDIGCVANKTAVQVGDDVFFLARDGVRGVFRTQQDKLQAGRSEALSYMIKSSVDSLNWTYIQNSCAVYFDNKYFIAVPTGTSTYNNEVWVFYPATNAWAVYTGLNVGAWAKLRISGQERLYYIDSNDGKVYRAFKSTSYDDNGSDITYTFIGREEDGGNRLIQKVGGEVEVEAMASASADTLTVLYSIDGTNDYTSLGTMDLVSGTAPLLPIDLPFYLADTYTIRKKFHLDGLGPWKTIQFKITCASQTDIVVYGYTLITYTEEYLHED
jgi:hypothetical protein